MWLKKYLHSEKTEHGDEKWWQRKTGCADEVVSITEGKKYNLDSIQFSFVTLGQCSLFDYFPKPAN